MSTRGATRFLPGAATPNAVESPENAFSPIGVIIKFEVDLAAALLAVPRVAEKCRRNKDIRVTRRPTDFLIRLAHTESPMSTLDAVLDRIDRDIDQCLDRLFALLRIASVSTDPAFAGQCRAAAEHVAADLKSIGFETSVRPTEGHPVVVGKANGAAGPRVLFYGHYDVQPVDPLNLWKTPPFEPRVETLPDGRKIIVARGACDDKGQAMTFIEDW